MHTVRKQHALITLYRKEFDMLPISLPSKRCSAQQACGDGCSRPDYPVARTVTRRVERDVKAFRCQSTPAPIRVQNGGRVRWLGGPAGRPSSEQDSRQGPCVVQAASPNLSFFRSPAAGRGCTRATPLSSRSSRGGPRPPPTHPAAAPWRRGSPRPPRRGPSCPLPAVATGLGRGPCSPRLPSGWGAAATGHAATRLPPLAAATLAAARPTTNGTFLPTTSSPSNRLSHLAPSHPSAFLREVRVPFFGTCRTCGVVPFSKPAASGTYIRSGPTESRDRRAPLCASVR